MKNPVTPAGIEPATFLFVAQHLNHCATAVPIFKLLFQQILIIKTFTTLISSVRFIHKSECRGHSSPETS